MTSKQHAAVGLEFVDVSVNIHGHEILENISASVPCGSATVIVGPNGAGKTSLLRCFLGEMPCSGRIFYVDGKGAELSSAVVGYVPQQLRADAHLPLKVYEFLAISQTRPLWLGCSGAGKRKHRELLQMVEAEKLENQRLAELSGGELRRVLLAAALGKNPELLVLDEAEAGVDYRGERLFWDLLDKSRKAYGFTLLMVTHNLPLAAHYASHVIAIKKRLLAEGPPRQALTSQNLLDLFGVPIHLYPAQCEDPGPVCLQCGAFGKGPHMPEIKANQSGASLP